MRNSKYYKLRKKLIEQRIVTGLDRRESEVLYVFAIRIGELPVRIKHKKDLLNRTYTIRI